MARLRTALDGATAAIAGRDARVTELERLLDEARRAGKHQAAPFRKGEPSDEPAGGQWRRTRRPAELGTAPGSCALDLDEFGVASGEDTQRSPELLVRSSRGHLGKLQEDGAAVEDQGGRSEHTPT